MANATIEVSLTQTEGMDLLMDVMEFATEMDSIAKQFAPHERYKNAKDKMKNTMDELNKRAFKLQNKDVKHDQDEREIMCE